MAAYHLLIKGKVQGVFYRAFAKQEAKKLGVAGWIKNLPDGDVAVEITGREEKLQAFISWCNTGPRGAVVGEVIVTPIEEGTFHGFSIIE